MVTTENHSQSKLQWSPSENSNRLIYHQIWSSIQEVIENVKPSFGLYQLKSQNRKIILHQSFSINEIRKRIFVFQLYLTMKYKWGRLRGNFQIFHLLRDWNLLIKYDVITTQVYPVINKLLLLACQQMQISKNFHREIQVTWHKKVQLVFLDIFSYFICSEIGIHGYQMIELPLMNAQL